MAVKIKIPNINKVIKTMDKFGKILFQVATRLELLILNNWRAGKGADDKKFDRLTDGYKKFKVKKGRHGIRNLIFSGLMVGSLDPKRKSKFEYVLGFQDATSVKKAQGNVKHAPNMMKPISDRIDKKLQRLAFDLFKRGKLA